jgi:hypothetical protein
LTVRIWAWLLSRRIEEGGVTDGFLLAELNIGVKAPWDQAPIDIAKGLLNLPDMGVIEAEEFFHIIEVNLKDKVAICDCSRKDVTLGEENIRVVLWMRPI